MSSTWSLSMMLRPLMGTFGGFGRLGAGGDDDVFGAEGLFLRELVTRTVCGSMKPAIPLISSTLLRDNCAWMTSTSVLITCWTRNARSAIVILSLTR